jgi:protocatechuate 3,4-dioxygenase beta subunit
MLALVMLALGVPLGVLAQQGQVGGQVRNGTTGEAIARADLLLRRADVDPNSTSLPTAYSTIADEKGHFVFDGVEPGKYRLSAMRAGFVTGEFGAPEPLGIGSTLSVEGGQQMGNLTFALTPQAVFTGHVLDEQGDPIPRLQVQALGYRYNRGRKQLASFGSALTDDLGEYRIFGLAPGRYFLSATYRANALEASATSSTQVSDEEYAPMYYPRGTDPMFATTIEARPGAQLTGIDFVLSKTPTVHIRGRVDNPLGGAGSVMLAPSDPTRMLGANRTYLTDPQGRFEIRGVIPGPYTVVASVLDSRRSLTARRAVDIGHDLEDFTITIPPPVEVSGHVRIDGDQMPNLSSVRVSLQPRQRGAVFGPMPSAKVEGDGSFTLADISPDDYYAVAVGLPEGYFVKSIKAGNDDILDTGLNLNRTSPRSLDILLSPHAGFVKGAVINADKHVSPGSTVVLVPQDEKRREREQYYAMTTADQDGRFTLKNLDPGVYEVFAWEDVEFDAWMDPEFLKRFDGKALQVTVGEDSNLELNLKLIPVGNR